MNKFLRKKGISAPPNGKGIEYCEYLDENGRCSVYEERPIICRAFGVVKSKLLVCKMENLPQSIPESADLRRYALNKDLVNNRAADIYFQGMTKR